MYGGDHDHPGTASEGSVEELRRELRDDLDYAQAKADELRSEFFAALLHHIVEYHAEEG